MRWGFEMNAHKRHWRGHVEGVPPNRPVYHAETCLADADRYDYTTDLGYYTTAREALRVARMAAFDSPEPTDWMVTTYPDARENTAPTFRRSSFAPAGEPLWGSTP